MAEWALPFMNYMILIAIMFFSTLLGIFSPLILIRLYHKVENESTKIRYIGFLSCTTMFTSGIFLGLALLHMLPDVKNDFNNILDPSIVQFPVGEFLVGFGLLFMIIIDQILIFFQENQIDNSDPIARLNREEPQIVGGSRDMLPDIPVIPKPTIFHAFVLFLSLACHSLFEGFVITTQQNSETSLLAIFVSILIHKFVVAFGLGLNSAQTDMSRTTFVLLSLFFASMTPTGMLLGLPVEYFLPIQMLNWVSSTIEGVACGTFLYVVCFELLPIELQRGRFRLLKIVMIIGGYGSMAVFVYLLN